MIPVIFCTQKVLVSVSEAEFIVSELHQEWYSLDACADKDPEDTRVQSNTISPVCVWNWYLQI